MVWLYRYDLVRALVRVYNPPHIQTFQFHIGKRNRESTSCICHVCLYVHKNSTQTTGSISFKLCRHV
jgi:hypothetical protein